MRFARTLQGVMPAAHCAEFWDQHSHGRYTLHAGWFEVAIRNANAGLEREQHATFADSAAVAGNVIHLSDRLEAHAQIEPKSLLVCWHGGEFNGIATGHTRFADEQTKYGLTESLPLPSVGKTNAEHWDRFIKVPKEKVSDYLVSIAENKSAIVSASVSCRVPRQGFGVI